jgi:hypothetical protein
MMKLDLSENGLKAAKFKGPVRFIDGRGGMARQDYQCVDEPRFGYFWQRNDRKDKGRQAYMVDGVEVADLAEAAAAKEGLRPSGVNAEGFNCAETVPPGIMARIEAARAAIARAAA